MVELNLDGQKSIHGAMVVRFKVQLSSTALWMLKMLASALLIAHKLREKKAKSDGSGLLVQNMRYSSVL